MIYPKNTNHQVLITLGATYCKTLEDGSVESDVIVESDDIYNAELSEVKSIKITQIKRDRDVACTNNVTAHSRQWQADALSKSLLSDEILTTKSGVPMSPVWRDASNDNMPLTDIQQLIDIAAAMKAQAMNAYITSWTRKAAVASATTFEQVEAA